MKRIFWQRIVVGLVVVLAGLGVWRLAARAARRAEGVCRTCHRSMPRDTLFSALVGGREVRYCCPRCWVTTLRTSDGKYERPMATDYVSRKWVPAGQCVFVEGSDVMPCCDPSMTRGNEGLPAEQYYDRCYPSVIAFASPEEALNFTREHGGAIISFQGLTDEARTP